MKTGKQAPYINRIYFICWITYFGTYLGRINFSASLPLMIEEFNRPLAVFGAIGTAFFLAYGMGQFINGFIGDKLNPKYMVFIGLFGSAIVNVSISFTSSIALMTVLWGVNGWLQSLIWSPILKMLSLWLPSTNRERAGVTMQTTVVFGSFAAYLVSAAVLNLFDNWHASFGAGGVLLFGFAFLWLFGISATERRYTAERDQDLGEEIQRARIAATRMEAEEKNISSKNGAKGMSLQQIILGAGLLIVCIAILSNGILKDAINVWTPTLITDVFGFTPSLANIITMLLPLASVTGVWFSAILLQKTGNIMTASALFYAIAAVALVFQGFLNDTSIVATMICIGVASSAMIGANGLLIGVLPMKFFKWGKVSSIAGFLNGFTYIGSALSGVGIGLLAELGGWSVSFIGLGIFSVVGLVACLLSSGRLSEFLNNK